ncbi:MAG TPA: fibronectin type III domain-containing protein [Gaiellaceae bacterium]|nr:fibronectin type III domain-containing protein [Gaiellaceae bacterium]
MTAARNITRRHVARLPAVALAVLILAATASAATAPTVTTGATTSVTSSSGAVTATVNPNGTTTTAYFELGTSTSYGTKSPSATVGNGTAAVAFDYTFTGLTPGTTYDYRVVATSSAGPADGTNGIFTTSASPAPVVTTAAASSISSTGATLNGSVNPNGQTSSWYFEYGKTASYGSKTSSVSAGNGTTATNVSAPVTKLSTGQAYHFRLVAVSPAGTTNGADMTFTPAGGPAATTSAASSVTSSGAKLNGSVNPNGQATSVYFDYGTTTSYGSKTPVTNAGSGTSTSNVSAMVNGLAPGVYHFRLVATSPAGTTAGSDLTFGSAPPAVQTGTAQGASTSGVTLTGSVNPQGNATSWYFEYGASTSYGTKTPAKSAGSGVAAAGVSAAITKLVPGASYHYRLVGTSGSGTTFGSDVTFTTVAAITIATSTLQSVYGHYATLSGSVSTRQAGVTVTILSQPFGSKSYAKTGSVVTGNGGAWTFAVRPKLVTSYEASSPDGTSQPVSVGVRPAVSLRKITRARFATRVVSSASFTGKLVQLQRALPGGRWQTVAKARLNGKSSATFAASRLPHGTSTIRIAMSVNQAGPGYLGGFSRTLTYHRA